MRKTDIGLLLLIDANEAIHRGSSVGPGGSVQYLKVDRGKVVVRIGKELSAKFGELLDGKNRAGRVGMASLPCRPSILG